MAASKRTRFNVFKRDRFVCQYCGRTPPTVVLHCDHVIPSSKGGPDDEDNLVTSCEDCNQGKSNISLDEVPQTISAKMVRIAEKREQIEAFNEFLMAEREIEDGQIHELGVYWFKLICKKSKYVFAGDYERSMRTFVRRLPCAEIIDAMDVAASRKPATLRSDLTRWKYFCGVCWSKIRQAEGGE